MHERLQQLHRQVFHGPFGKPKDVPHLLTRISSLMADFMDAHDYAGFPKREAIIELMGLLVLLLVRRAKHLPQLSFPYWDRAGRDHHRLWREDREKFLLWWSVLHRAQTPIQFPQQKGFRPIPPIPINF